MRNQRIRFAWWAGAAIASGLIAGGVGAQPPDPASETASVPQRPGLFHRLFHHTSHTLHDKLIGYPENFVEPPLGTYVREQLSLEVAKADPHRFTLYRSDFLPGTDRFSPGGAARFNRMYSRIPSSPDPVIVEWTPDEPGLAAARRQAVLATFQRAGRPMAAERVVIGPSPYPGAMAVEAGNNFSTILMRSQQAGATYPPTPQPVASGYQGGGSR
jgi:hypothetical protein